MVDCQILRECVGISENLLRLNLEAESYRWRIWEISFLRLIVL